MDFAHARYNMVEQQIRPWDILNFELLDVLSEIPREYFVLPEHQALAYVDESLPLINGQFMPEPRIIAKMVQALDIQKTERVLDIGTGSGYAAAVLAGLAQSVLSLDTDIKQLEFARDALLKAQIQNVQLDMRDGLSDISNLGQFDIIYVGGSIESIPAELFNALNDKGRLVAVVGTGSLMFATLVTRQGNSFQQVALFETATPALTVAQAAKPVFEF